jgi:flavin-binding protein dodecin
LLHAIVDIGECSALIQTANVCIDIPSASAVLIAGLHVRVHVLTHLTLALTRASVPRASKAAAHARSCVADFSTLCVTASALSLGVSIGPVVTALHTTVVQSAVSASVGLVGTSINGFFAAQVRALAAVRTSLKSLPVAERVTQAQVLVVVELLTRTASVLSHGVDRLLRFVVGVNGPVIQVLQNVLFQNVKWGGNSVS